MSLSTDTTLCPSCPQVYVPSDAPTVHLHIPPICPSSSSSPSCYSLPISISIPVSPLPLHSFIHLFIITPLYILLSHHFIYYYHTTLLFYFQNLHTCYLNPCPSSNPHSFLFRFPASLIKSGNSCPNRLSFLR